jgi:hypothetical protein
MLITASSTTEAKTLSIRFRLNPADRAMRLRVIEPVERPPLDVPMVPRFDRWHPVQVQNKRQSTLRDRIALATAVTSLALATISRGFENNLRAMPEGATLVDSFLQDPSACFAQAFYVPIVCEPQFRLVAITSDHGGAASLVAQERIGHAILLLDNSRSTQL